MPLHLQSELSAEQREVLRDIQEAPRRLRSMRLVETAGMSVGLKDSGGGKSGGMDGGSGGRGGGIGGGSAGGGGGGGGGGGRGGGIGGGGGGGSGGGGGIPREKMNDPVFRESLRSYVDMIIEDAAGIAEVLMETSRAVADGQAKTL
ncbi:unnamed protein product, partial [Ixodes hexagonus]